MADIFSKQNLPQTLCALAVSLSTLSEGMQFGWSSPFIPNLKSNSSTIKITQNQEIWLEMNYMIGSLVGLPFAIFLVDNIGRKYTILAGSFCGLLAWSLMGFGNSAEYILTGRLFAGIALCNPFVPIPMYISEVADKNIRGFLTSFIQILVLVGMLLIYSIGPYVNIYVPSIIGIFIILIQATSMLFIPDSPYFLIAKQRQQKARSALVKLRNWDNIDSELEEITAAIKRQRSEKGNLKELFTIKSNRKAFIITTFLNASLPFGGGSVIVMNLHHLLQKANSDLVNGNVAGIIFATVMLITAVVTSLYIDKFGRKVLLITSSITTAICLLVLAVFFSLQRSEVNVGYISWLPGCSVVFYAINFNYGIGTVPLIMTPELFSAKVKAFGMTSAQLVYTVFGLVSIEIYRLLGDDTFYVFAVFCTIMALFSIFCIPETKGKTLDEIQYMLKGEYYPSMEFKDGYLLERK